ncbi:antifreeze protein [Pseudooceanicola sp. MF1-13]|uniref:antifreeze protein n=1 Tax=Pseudooceanicola sp. MF1-13 TaxID=3379095 RepID=UPI003892521E
MANDTKDIMRSAMAMWRLGMDAQVVVAYRMAGMMGALALPPGEEHRMVAEKMTAFRDAAIDGSWALASGKSLQAATQVALKPIEKQVAANKRRLTRS